MQLNAFSDESLAEETGVRIAFLQRTGGVSKGVYESLNTGIHVGDSDDSVRENRLRIACAFSVEMSQCVTPCQVHGKVIREIDETSEACVNGCDDEEADGVAVSVSEVATLLSFADCVPIIIVTPRLSFAVVHAGWRGVVQRVAVSGLEALARLDGSAFSQEFCKRCNVYIGPHIQKECFEVGEEVRAQFLEQFSQQCLFRKTHINLSAALRDSLVECGVEERRISEVGECTVCNPQKYFSYRKSGGSCGRQAAFAVRHEREQ